MANQNTEACPQNQLTSLLDTNGNPRVLNGRVVVLAEPGETWKTPFITSKMVTRTNQDGIKAASIEEVVVIRPGDLSVPSGGQNPPDHREDEEK